MCLHVVDWRPLLPFKHLQDLAPMVVDEKEGKSGRRRRVLALAVGSFPVLPWQAHILPSTTDKKKECGGTVLFSVPAKAVSEAQVLW